MGKIAVVLLSLLIGSAVSANDKVVSGAYLGAKDAETPHWFKNSFLEFEDDVAEAAQHGRRVMLYFHQDGCPYCARLVEENFADEEIEAYVRKHFEGIEINMWGDRDVVSVGGKSFTEKTFAAALKVQYTPTVIFLDEQGKPVLRLNGYYPSEDFRLALRFAGEKRERQKSFNEFVAAARPAIAQGLIDEDFWLDSSDLQRNRIASERYLAVYFEAADCEQCRIMHERILTDPPTRHLVRRLDNLQIDVLGDAPITLVTGERVTHREFARRLNIGYTPSVVFFDSDGREVHRIEGFVKTFHFQSSLAYVLEHGYQSEPSFQRFIAARGEKLREQGFDTDIWGYKSFHSINE